MATGIGLLGIPARDLWAMTPREYAAAVSGRFGTPSTDPSFRRTDLADLMRRFPDTSA